MRTTIDLPDDLYRKAKVLAAQRGVSLKTLIAESLAKSVVSDAAPQPKRGRSTPFPVLFDGRVKALTGAEIAEILAEEDRDS